MVDDVVTCGLSDAIGDVRERVERSRHDFALVVSAGGVVLGRLPGAVLAGDPAARAEDVMEPGPSTVRPDRKLDSLLERLRSKNLTSSPVTDPEGRLLGVVFLEDVEAELGRR
jgi:CBS domain-containing protein